MSEESLNITRALVGLLLDRMANTTTTSGGLLSSSWLHHQREFRDWQRLRLRHASLVTVLQSRWDRISLPHRAALMDLVCFDSVLLEGEEEEEEHAFYALGEQVAVDSVLAAAASGRDEEDADDELACLRTLSRFELCFAAVDQWRARFATLPVTLTTSPWVATQQTRMWLKLDELVRGPALSQARIRFANELVFKLQSVLARLPRQEAHLSPLVSLYQLGQQHGNTYLCQLCLQSLKRLALESADHAALIQACHLAPQDPQLLQDTCRADASFCTALNAYLLQHKRYADLLFDHPASLEQAIHTTTTSSNARELLWLSAMRQGDYSKAARALQQQQQPDDDDDRQYDALALLCHYAAEA